ncbi:MAG: hypothetical protein ABSF10_05315, partial [Verrucomicrobiota bacterium]
MQNAAVGIRNRIKNLRTADDELTQVKHYQRKEGGCGGKESLTHNSAYRQESQNYGQQIKERI